MSANLGRGPRFDSVQCLSPGGLHRFAWAEWGERDNPRVLVCVHGLTQSGRDFDALGRALASDYRVVCPDIAGRGRSDWFADEKNYNVRQYVSDCVTLLARLGVPQIDWLGTSMGGLIGMVLASSRVTANATNPIRKLVLNDVGPVLNEPALLRIGEVAGESPRFETLEEGLAYLQKIHASCGPHTEEEWRELNQHDLVRDGAGYKLHCDPRLGPAFLAPIQKAAGAGGNPWSGYDRIRCPTLAIRGGGSELLSAEAHQEMSERGPKAQLLLVAGVGHAPTLVHQSQIDPVRDFLLA